MKQAQSQIITTVLIILLVLAAIVIVWQVVESGIGPISPISFDDVNFEIYKVECNTEIYLKNGLCETIDVACDSECIDCICFKVVCPQCYYDERVPISNCDITVDREVCEVKMGYGIEVGDYNFYEEHLTFQLLEENCESYYDADFNTKACLKDSICFDYICGDRYVEVIQ